MHPDFHRENTAQSGDLDSSLDSSTFLQTPPGIIRSTDSATHAQLTTFFVLLYRPSLAVSVCVLAAAAVGENGCR